MFASKATHNNARVAATTLMMPTATYFFTNELLSNIKDAFLSSATRALINDMTLALKNTHKER